MGRCKIPETVVTQKVGEELVILDLESGNYYGLDPVGARMVELLREHDVPEAAELLHLEYDAEKQRILADLENLLAELEHHGLVECEDAP